MSLGYWRQCLGMVWHTRVTPQDPAQKVSLRRVGHFGGADSFAGVDFFAEIIKKIIFLQLIIF